MIKRIGMILIVVCFLAGCGDEKVINSKEMNVESNPEDNSSKVEAFSEKTKESIIGNITYQVKDVSLLNKELENSLNLKPLEQGFQYYVVAMDYEVGKKSTNLQEDGEAFLLNSTAGHSIQKVLFADIDNKAFSEFYGHPVHYIWNNLSPGTTGTRYEVYEISETIAKEDTEWFLSQVKKKETIGNLYVGSLQ